MRFCFYSGGMTDLFRKSVYTIPAGVPFASALADGIGKLAGDSESLARAMIMVPSRRAAQSLRAAFLEIQNGQASLLPRIVPLGDVEDDSPDMLSMPDIDALCPPAIDPLKRQLTLARLLRGFTLGGMAPTPPQTVMLADSLGRLLDALSNADAKPAQLRELLPDRFSVHWQDIIALLSILNDRWPLILEEGGVIDAADRRNRLLRLRCDIWREQCPQDMIIIAGSTGTFASTRELIGCVVDLPNGHVVLPGLDTTAGDDWQHIRDDAGHPQHQLSVLLDSLDMVPGDLLAWPHNISEAAQSSMRRALMRQAFKPAALTADWRQLGSTQPDLGRDALAGLTVLEAPNRATEANMIALAMREVLEEPEKTAALITPDRQLAEAVIAALQRWGIDADDSAGRPLSECGAGGFLMLLVQMIGEDFSPLSALGFLKHPKAAGGMPAADFRKKVRDMERKLWRGYRPAPGIDGILSCLEPGSDLHVFVDQHIAVPLADLCAIWKNTAPTLSSLAGALGRAAERMASCRQLEDGSIDEADGAEQAWRGDDGRAAADLLSAMVAQGSSFEADPKSFPHILKTLMDGKTVRPSWPAHPRLSILGPVEARMQSADRLIIGGFNEGNWPPRPETDPWMNAEMRQSAGLLPHNWRSGLSAHDVWMAICTPDVIVTRALRDGDVVTTPSRWLQRLEAVLAALQITDALDRGDVIKTRLSMLAPVPAFSPVGRPEPCPPVDVRPRTFSATEIDDWISDPYSIYAKRILGLRPLDDIDRAPDAALRGNIVHDALAAFIKAHPKGPFGSDALGELRAFGRRYFEPFWQISSVRVFWWPAFELMSAWFIETEGRRRADLARSHVEVDGNIPIDAPAGPAAIKARADRIDQMQDGGLAVLDYKTGSVPAVSEVEAGRRTQLLTEAVIAAYGGFAGIDAAPVIAMQYWKLAGRRGEAGRIVNVMPDGWQADAARASLAALFTSFDDPATAYASLPDPSVRLPFARYDHLSRVDEWLPAASANGGADSIQAQAFIQDHASQTVGAGDRSDIDKMVAADASRQQEAASDPAVSVFVSANAGTGKTKLLTDRVLRLMLDGAPPESILCVTYTRAAAAEMQNRISARLAEWTVMTSDDLAKDLAAMGIAVPSQSMLRNARSLFAEILDSDDGPRIETVHSFCQSILRRFPIEAGIVPNAELADELEQARLKMQVRESLMQSGDPAMESAIATLAEHAGEGNADDLLANLVRAEQRLDDPAILANLDAHFIDNCGVPADLDPEALLSKALDGIDSERLRAAAAVLADCEVKTHVTRAAQITTWLGEDDFGRRYHIDLLISTLFTNGQPSSERGLSNAALRAQLPDLVGILQSVQRALAGFVIARIAERCRQLTRALYVYGRAFHVGYTALKRRLGLLDYDDLIGLTNALLQQSDAAEWVAWKLDSAIRHMLVDEAQDTSPPQWQLLRRLSDEFFDSPMDDPDARRTLFIVGDFKQSIYSFQGADPAVLGVVRLDLQTRARTQHHPLRDLSLDVSFRTAQPVLDLVNRVMDGLDGITDPPRLPDFLAHRSARKQVGGFVGIWPVTKVEANPRTLPMFAPPAVQLPEDAAAQAAADVTRRLAGMIGSHRLSSGRLLQPGDVMILLRKRGRYYKLLMAALQRAGLPVAGADRMTLQDQIEIKDLLALGDVVLLPEDDLQLATVLKSPLFGLDEDGLFELAHGRGDASLYARLMSHRGADSDIGRMAERLSHFRAVADRASVFSFFSTVLGACRQAFRARLGSAVDEALDHFLALAQSFGNGGGVSLTEFLALVRGSGGEVRRDMDAAAANEIRVMTIHGAKGLEAPLVVLPDMLRASSNRDRLIKDSQSDFVYWAPSAGGRPDFVTTAKMQVDDAAKQEENRLLYVAMTRARDGLVIGGWEAAHQRFMKSSAYERIRDAATDMGSFVTEDDGTLRLQEDAPPAPVARPVDTSPPPLAKDADKPLWLEQLAPVEPSPPRPLRPSQPDEGARMAPAPGTGIGAASTAMARGRLAHRLFEILPAIAPSQRADAARRMVASQTDVSAEAGGVLIDDVMKVMAMPALADLFSERALAEVSISGVVGGDGVAGQIDRLYVGAGQVLVADFKTGPMPQVTPAAYTRQMALYAALLEQIYPDDDIVTLLVWTEAAQIQELSADARQAALNPGDLPGTA